jgi:putative phosphoesterase
VRIGVVADTHVGERLPELPGEVCEALAGVDLILHAGDIIDPAALDVLRRVAPVVAVRGNHDEREGHRELPRDVLVRAGGVRIGLTHGHRRAAAELPAIVLSLVAGRPLHPGFDRTMRGRFPDADCVVVGHLHQPIHRRVGGVLLFSPGAVYAPERDSAYNCGRARAMAYRRYRRGLPPEALRPGVGLIEAGPGVLRARVIPLLRPIRSAA